MQNDDSEDEGEEDEEHIPEGNDVVNVNVNEADDNDVELEGEESTQDNAPSEAGEKLRIKLEEHEESKALFAAHKRKVAERVPLDLIDKFCKMIENGKIVVRPPMC